MGSDLDIMDFGVHCHAISVTFFHGSACLMACAGKTLVCIWSCLFFRCDLVWAAGPQPSASRSQWFILVIEEPDPAIPAPNWTTSSLRVVCQGWAECAGE